MKKILIAFSVIASVIMVFTVFSDATAASFEPSTSSSNWQVVVSPPKVVLNSINYLENEPGFYRVSNGYSVVSENGVIKITDTSGNWTVIVFSTPSLTTAFQYKIVYNSTYDGQENTTDIMLESNNGYFYNVTNFQGQVTDILNVSVTNKTTSAMVIAEYPIFATVRIIDQVGPDIIIGPPPGGGPFLYWQPAYSEWLYTGNEEEQVWENVSIWYWQNSSNSPPTFVRASVDEVAETSEYVDFHGWEETNGYVSYSGGNGNHYGVYYDDPAIENNNTYYGTHLVYVGGLAYDWFFVTAYFNETTYSLIGHTVWENGTFYYQEYNAIPLGTSVDVTIT